MKMDDDWGYPHLSPFIQYLQQKHEGLQKARIPPAAAFPVQMPHQRSLGMGCAGDLPGAPLWHPVTDGRLDLKLVDLQVGADGFKGRGPKGNTKPWGR